MRETLLAVFKLDPAKSRKLAEPLLFLAVPASDRGTLIRLRTGPMWGVGTVGEILGEYHTAPTARGARLLAHRGGTGRERVDRQSY